jgi:hypothetical protein
MGTKLTTKTLTVAMLATLFTGMFIGSMLTWKCGKKGKATLMAIDTLLVYDYKTDTTVCYDTIVLTRHDTVFITPETPIGEIPVRTQTAGFCIPVEVDVGKKHRWDIAIEVGTTYRGILYQNTVRPVPEPYTIEIEDKRPFVDLYGTVAVGVNWDLRPMGETEVGLIFRDRVAVFGKCLAGDYPLQFKPYAGIKYFLF